MLHLNLFKKGKQGWRGTKQNQNLIYLFIIYRIEILQYMEKKQNLDFIDLW